MKNRLSSIYQNHGEGAFRDGKMLLNLHNDLFPREEQDRRLLKLLLMADGNTRLLDARKKSPGDQSIAITRLAKQLQSDWGLQPAVIREMLSAFWLAVGGSGDALKSIAEKAAPKPAPAPKTAQKTASTSTPSAKTAQKNTPNSSPISGASSQPNPSPMDTKQIIPPTAVCHAKDYGMCKGDLYTYTGNDPIIRLPFGTVKICEDAFVRRTIFGEYKSSSHIREVFIPKGIKHIEKNAFYRCAELHAVLLPEGLQTIGASAFSHCKSLQSLSFPESLQKISPFAFDSCIALQTVTFMGGLTSIECYTFSHCEALQSVILPPNLQTIEECAFLDCVSLRSINIPDSVMHIAPNAFQFCHNIKVVASDYWKKAHPDFLSYIENPPQ